MPFETDIEGRGFDAIAQGVEDLAHRAYVLGPVSFQIRERVLESERRIFAAAPWPAKKRSTLRRYRYPMDHFAADFEAGMEFTPGTGATRPLRASGILEATLTKAHAPGQKDSTRQVRGGLDVGFGVKNRGPVAYANFQPGGHGGRLKRDPFHFDSIAHDDAAGDVVEHMIGRYGEGT